MSTNWADLSPLVVSLFPAPLAALFYSRLMFLPLWAKHSNRAMTKASHAELAAKAFCINVFAAGVLSKLIGLPASLAGAVTRGLVTGAGIGGVAIAHNYIFTGADMALFFVDILFVTLQHGVMAGTLYQFHSPHIWTK
jgi:hypothetical protein